MAKKKKRNYKRVNKELNRLLKEKRSIDDIAMLEKSDNSIINGKKMSNNTNTSNKKREVIIAPERKNTTKRKESVVVPERKKVSSGANNHTDKKRKVVVSQKTKQQLKRKTTTQNEISEHTLRLNQLVDDMKSLYDAENVIEDIKKEQEKLEEPDFYEDPSTLVTDAIVHKGEDEILPKRKINALNIIAVILFVIFILLLIAFIVFLIYVCTY